MFDESQTKLLWEHPTSIVYEKKLDSALRDTSIRLSKKFMRLNDSSNYPFDVKMLLNHVKEDDILDSRTDNSCYALILRKLLMDSKIGIIYGNHRLDKMSHAFKMAKDNLKFQHEYSSQANNSHMKINASELLDDKLKLMQPDLYIKNIMSVTDHFRKIIDKQGFTKRNLPSNMSNDEKIQVLGQENKYIIEVMGIKIIWGMKHSIITIDDDQPFFMPNSYILLIHNKLSDLLSVYLLCMYQQGISMQDNATSVFLEFLREMCKLSIKFKDLFAEITSVLEGLVIGETLKEVEDWQNDDLLNNLDDALENSIHYNYIGGELQNILCNCDIPLRNEIGCCSKLFGHPFVDIEGGARKLHERTTSKKELTYEAMIWVVNKAKETFVKNYLTRHGKWPLVDITSPYPGKDPLMRAMLLNKYPDHPDIVKKYGKVQMMDWARVELGKVMEYQNLENVIPFLKDKSVSVLKSVAVRNYLRKGSSSHIKWEETRLLLYYLLNPLKKLDHNEFIKTYAGDEGIDLLADYLIIRIVPKEKEHKIKFRGFGVKTYLDRLRTIAQEKNVANFLSLYCDEQAMTLGELEISKRLYAIRTLIKAYTNHYILYINCDSQAWNNNFRNETVFPTMSNTIGKIFDSPVAAKIHAAYENSLILINDGDVTYSWEGQQGGIDGLNQYSWVWVYVNQIKYAMKDLPVKYHMFCKGDDMRLAVVIKPELLIDHDVKHWHKIIMENVSIAAAEFGHTIKVQESYGSGKFFSFSKCASIGTIELPQAFRKIQKVYGANNAMINTLDEYIAASFSNAHSACRYTTNTYGCYFVALVWGYYYLLLSDHFKRTTDTELLSLLLIPNMLGGFPIIYLHNMRVRAESDLLSPFLNMVKHAKLNNELLYLVLIRFLKCEVPSKRNMTKLYKDPYSLWIKTPVQPTAVLRSFILPALKKIVRNEDIRDLIKASESSENRTLIANLAKAYPQDAKILSTIYAATPEGILGELMRKFESGRSILELLILRYNKHAADFKLKKVLITERNLQKWRFNKVKNNEHSYGRMIIDPETIVCPAKSAQNLRDTTWNTRIVGVSMPPLAHQITLSSAIHSSSSQHACYNHFLYTYTPPQTFLYPDCPHHWSVSNSTPFLGYTTRTGNIAPSVTFQEHDPLLVKVKNLLDILTWVNKSITNSDGTTITSNIKDLIIDILHLYTDISANDLSPFAAVRKSGTIQHHARSPRFRESIVPNTLSNMYQNVSGNSDSHVMLRTSDMHYKINFLHILCECIHMMQIELETGPFLSTFREGWGITSDCDYCNTPIEEEPMIIQDLERCTSNKGILKSCRIDNISRRLILNSFQDFNENQYKNPALHESPSAELAMLGVATEFIQHQYRIHQKLQNRFTHHVLSRSAKSVLVNMTHGTISRIIGFTELKKINYQTLLQAFIPIVSEFILNKLTEYNPDTIHILLSKVHTTELPWYELIENMHSAGRLGGFILYLKSVSGMQNPTCYENAMASATYIGSAVFKIIRDTKHPIQICIRTWMDEDSAKIELRYYMEPIRWRMLKTHFLELAGAWKPRTENDTLRISICRQALYTCSIMLDSDLIVRRLFHDLDPNILHLIKVNEYMDIDEDMIGITYSDDTGAGYKMMSWLMDHFKSWPWQIVKQEYESGYLDADLITKLMRNLPILNIEIGISDIASCILTLRSNVNMQDEMADIRDTGEFEDICQDENTMKFPQQITWGKIKGGHNEFVFKSKTDPSSSDTVSTITSTEHNFSCSRIILDNAHSFRVYGSGTTSQSKLDEIFISSGMNRVLPPSIMVICLADGYGGFLEYLSTCTYHSRFVFNTLPDRIGEGIIPFSATWTLKQNHNSMETHLLDVGLADLTKSEVKNRFISDYHNVSIITCDADVKWGDKVYAGVLIRNVIDIFLAVSNDNGVLICKCNLGYANLITPCISVLKRHCTRVLLVRCRASNIGGEVYIVANNPGSSPIDDIIFNATDLEHIEMDRFSNTIHKRFLYVKNNQPDINLYPAISKAMRYKKFNLIDSVTSKMFSRLSITCDFKNICTLYGTKSDIITHMINLVSPVIKHFLKCLTDPTVVTQRNVSYDQNTLAHLTFIKMKLMTAYGYHKVLNHRSSSRTLSKLTLRMDYCQKYDMLQGLVANEEKSSRHYNKNYKLNNMNEYCNPYMRYMDGIRLGQMICGYVQTQHDKIEITNVIND